MEQFCRMLLWRSKNIFKMTLTKMRCCLKGVNPYCRYTALSQRESIFKIISVPTKSISGSVSCKNIVMTLRLYEYIKQYTKEKWILWRSSLSSYISAFWTYWSSMQRSWKDMLQSRKKYKRQQQVLRISLWLRF